MYGNESTSLQFKELVQTRFVALNIPRRESLDGIYLSKLLKAVKSP